MDKIVKYDVFEINEDKDCKQGDTIWLRIKKSGQEGVQELSILHCGRRIDISSLKVISLLKEFLNEYA